MKYKNRIKNLIISPHLDDEVLGCFGILGPETFIVYCGVDESTITSSWVKKRPSKDERIEEMSKISSKFKFDFKILDYKVNYYVVQDLLTSFEYFINELKPETIFIPNPSYNQDHRSVYEAILIALRPHDVNFFVKKVLIYEQIQDLWNQNYHIFKPLYFIRINVQDKISAYLMYETQIRGFRSPDMIHSLAKLRGAQSNLDFAEAFEVLRWID